jgi:hypothetical protein
LRSRLIRSIHYTSIAIILLATLAASSIPGAAVGAVGSVAVAASTATAHAPQNITFHLEASAQGGEIAAVWLLYHAVGTPAVKRVRVPAERGSRVTLDYTLDTQVPYVPSGVDVEYRWLFTLGDGSETRTAPATLLYMDDSIPWKKTTSGPVTLWWYNGDDSIGKNAADTAARTIDKLKGTYNVPGDQPVRILVYASARDLQAALPPNSATWLGAVSTPELSLIQLVIDPTTPGMTSSASAQISRVVPHEITRLILYQASKNPYNTLPTWLDEGLATTNQETPDLRLRPLLYDAVTNGTLIPLSALNSPFPLDADQALLSYAESESVVGYIFNAYRPGTMPALVAAFKDGLSYDQAVQQVLKVSIDQLDKDWKGSLNYGGDQGGITG